MTVTDSITFRCRTVIVTGVIWTVIGLVTVVGAAVLFIERGDNAWGPSAVIGIVGVFLMTCGLGFLSSRLEIHTDSIATHWAFASQTYLLANLIDATLASRRRPGPLGHYGSSSDWVNAGSNGIVIGVGYLLKLVFHVLSWVAVPGSTDGESLHLIPRAGGAIPIPAISTRIDRQNDSAHQTLAAVRMAITTHNETMHREWSVREDPPGWKQPLPRWPVGGGPPVPPG